jgi:hypothetical protein
MQRVSKTWLLLALSAGLGCSASGGSPSAPGLTATTATFVSQGGALNNGVALEMQGFTDESVTFDVVLRNATQPITGAAVEVRFDSSTLTSLGGSAGPFLTGATTVSRAASPSREPGKLIAVFTQRDLYRGNVGSGTLGSFTMKLEPGGYSNFLDISSSVSTLFGPGGVPLTGETFAGGTLTVRRGY